MFLTASLSKLVHASLAERKDPKTEIHLWLPNYRNTPDLSTQKAPSELWMTRMMRTEIPTLIPSPTEGQLVG